MLNLLLVFMLRMDDYGKYKMAKSVRSLFFGAGASTAFLIITPILFISWIMNHPPFKFVSYFDVSKL